jgi:hypothetical protein
MTANELLMQFQADMLDVPVTRPKVAETTALGAAYAAGLADGVRFWKDVGELKKQWAVDKQWEPKMDAKKRARCVAASRRRRRCAPPSLESSSSSSSLGAFCVLPTTRMRMSHTKRGSDGRPHHDPTPLCSRRIARAP